ncbi:hypothetical protein PPYR_14238 [Photinus pyralis]|uniref:Uncharacterized protein n=2 Tax=Photinus pyralis TaxID=7054 RepID=A0A5N4A4T8_PHOPY|nr:hypothetical protein PPYR_14238 [Photinus pyralis]
MNLEKLKRLINMVPFRILHFLLFSRQTDLCPKVDLHQCDRGSEVGRNGRWGVSVGGVRTSKLNISKEGSLKIFFFAYLLNLDMCSLCEKHLKKPPTPHKLHGERFPAVRRSLCDCFLTTNDVERIV